MRRGIAIVVAGLLLAVATACEREKGPMERAGEKLDAAVGKITHSDESAVEKAGRKADELVEDVKKDLE
jgi:hypothetical protein